MRTPSLRDGVGRHELFLHMSFATVPCGIAVALEFTGHSPSPNLCIRRAVDFRGIGLAITAFSVDPIE